MISPLHLSLAMLVLATISATSALKTATFCSRECYVVSGTPGCGNVDLPVVATVNISTCYPGPGTFRGSTKYSSYAVRLMQAPSTYSVVFFSDARCSHPVATTSKCLAGRCCVGDFFIPPSPQDNRGDVPFFFVPAP